MINNLSNLEEQNLTQQKQQLRQLMKQKLVELSEFELAQHARQILKKLLIFSQFQQAKSCFVYLATKSEISTQAILENLWQAQKIVLVPKIIEGQLKAVQINSWQDLILGQWQILEPKSEQVWQSAIDLSLIPGLAFTLDGQRLGRGKGFYDQFLSTRQSKFNLGLAHQLQIVSELPQQSWDVKLDLVLTEK